MSSVPPTEASYEEIVWLAGPRLLGILFNWSLLGLLTAQVYVYYLNFPKDRSINKLLVYGLYVCDWAQTCSATYDAFQWFVYGWGSVPRLFGIFTTWLNVPVFGSLIGLAVQLFFGWRIYLLGRSYILPGLIAALAVMQFAGGIAVAYFLYTEPFEVSRSGGVVRAVGVRLGGSAAADILIAGAMTFFLLRSREHAVGHMNNVITRLVRLTIETGSVTAVAAILDLVFFLTQHNGLHQVSGVILGKLYTNTLLVLYNNRAIMAASKTHSDAHTTRPTIGPFRVATTNTELQDVRTGSEVDWSARTMPIQVTTKTTRSVDLEEAVRPVFPSGTGSYVGKGMKLGE